MLKSFQIIFFVNKYDFGLNKMKKTETPEMSSKVLSKFLIRNYEWFQYFFTNLNFDDLQKHERKPSKFEHNKKSNFNHEKIKIM